MAKPKLSIGIIFKNEVRCLERCLKSFQDLRRAVPCEIAMADTGSTDGSHEIAAKYADILFDFPWNDDFAAARNAVMDRCSGKWFLSVDADEWLDKDFSQLLELVTSSRAILDKIGSVVVRNYQTEALDPERSTDFHAVRLVRMSSRIRYVGRIHEHIPMVGENRLMEKIILHHDGYVGQSTERGKAKLERNRKLLRMEVADHPDDVRLQCLYVESDFDQPDYWEQVCLLVQKVQEKKRYWEAYGPSALRHGVIAANNAQEWEKMMEWSDYACKTFPNSFFVRVDIAYTMAYRFWNDQDYAACADWCERYLLGVADLHEGRGDMTGLTFGTVKRATGASEQYIRSLQIKALYRCGRGKDADEILERTDCLAMNKRQFAGHVRLLMEARAQRPILALYARVCMPEHEELRKIYLQEAASAFASKYRKDEAEKKDFTRHAYTLFAPLEGKCEIGTAAVMLQSDSVQEIDALLNTVEDWDYLPVAALEHALEHGSHFPLAGKRLSLEEMDKLAGRLGRNRDLVAKLTLDWARELPEELHTLLWARGVAMIAVRTCDWQEAERDMALCRAFVKIVGTFVSRYYTREALLNDNLHMLPGMYRSAWYCREAFRALDGGDCGAYVRLLRDGVTAYPATRKMAMFLLDNTPEVQELLAPPPEVQEMADKIRAILARYDPDDPAVIALKASPAYQKVEWMLKSKPLSAAISVDVQQEQNTTEEKL